MFTQEFGYGVSLVEQTGDEASLKIAKDGGKSIGYLYGFLENIRKDFAIKEYSAECTTLEQVFNHFAKAQYKNSLRFNKSVSRIQK